MKYLQKIGKSLMLPVAALPICGILMGLGYLLCPASMQGKEVVGFVAKMGFYLVKAGGAVIDNMALLFVIGVSLGMSDDNHGSACLSGLISWLVITTMLSPSVMKTLMPEVMEDSVNALAFGKIQNPFIGILSGLLGAECYNRFKGVKLPDVFAFFSGRRFVAIITMLLSLILALVLGFVWPAMFDFLVKLGQKIVSIKGVGAGIFAFLNRLLIPSGLHHALNNVFWFDTIGLGDLTNFWAGKTSGQVGWSLGMYMSGFFPCMIGGIPGAALAFYHCAENKKKAAGVLFSTAFCAFLCGLTEPFEFSFMFLCFPLYVVYSVLTGIFSVITYYVGFRAGFSFSAGVIDLIFSSSLPAASRTWMIIPLSIAAFILYYLAFRFMIKKFHLPIPGVEEESISGSVAAASSAAGSSLSQDEKDLAKARGLLQAVGGRDNVVSTDCCATRLRLELKDTSLVDEKLAKSYGALGCLCPSANSCQIIIGLTVQQILEAFRKVMQEAPTETEAPVEVKTPAPVKAPAAPVDAVKAEPAGTKVSHGQPLFIELKKTCGKAAAEEVPSAQPSVICLPYEQNADGSISFSYIITDPSGIHARPAGQIVQIAGKYNTEVIVEAGGKIASASSPVQLMSLGVKNASEITVTISGTPAEAEAEAAELTRYISENL